MEPIADDLDLRCRGGSSGFPTTLATYPCCHGGSRVPRGALLVAGRFHGGVASPPAVRAPRPDPMSLGASIAAGRPIRRTNPCGLWLAARPVGIHRRAPPPPQDPLCRLRAGIHPTRGIRHGSTRGAVGSGGIRCGSTPLLHIAARSLSFCLLHLSHGLLDRERWQEVRGRGVLLRAPRVLHKMLLVYFLVSFSDFFLDH